MTLTHVRSRHPSAPYGPTPQIPAFDASAKDLALVRDYDDGRDHARIEAMREAMEGTMLTVRDRCVEYLNWYSPPFNTTLRRHDAWNDDIGFDDIGTTRSNFPIARAVVDIWAALEAAKSPTQRAEPERIPASPPVMDEQQALAIQQVYTMYKAIESRRADARSWLMRQFHRQDRFPLKHFRACRRKNLYGFTWARVLPDLFNDRPQSQILRNPTTVFPLWSDRDPDDIEALLNVQQMSATLANVKYELGLRCENGVITGTEGSRYREIPDGWANGDRTMVWIEDYWCVNREFGRDHRVISSSVDRITRVCGRIVDRQRYDGWRYVPFVPFSNADERDSYGWSDLAGVLDINDEMNRRISQEGDIIGMYASPRFQLLGSLEGATREMPAPFEMISLEDTERIEQIMTRIDVFPTQMHFQFLQDLLHRVTGLPPIVWGLINNAQTSGRALTASWKATETRLAPKLMENENSLRRWDSIELDYLHTYDWYGASKLFHDRYGKRFDDFTWDFPAMEPRDFQEVTLNAINKRDAGIQSTIDAMRETGDEAAEDTFEEVRAEWMDPVFHADKVQAQEMLKNARLQNMMQAQQLGIPIPGTEGIPTNPATVAQATGAAAQAAPAQGSPTGAPNGGPPAPDQQGAPQAPTQSTGTLIRNGAVSNQSLTQQRVQ